MASTSGAQQPGVSLTLCMIVRNEEHFLRRCLESVKDFVDEMVVVDTGSTDSTRDIAREFTDNLYDFEWVDDFAAARNFSLERATGDWILVLDADELMAVDDLREIRRLIADTDQDAFFLQQYNYSNNPLEKKWRPVRERTPFSGDYAGYRINPICRLFRNRDDIRYGGRVHEVVDRSLVEGSYTSLPIPVHHHIDSDPNKPKQQRQLNYLRILEQDLAEKPSGRGYSLAGAVCIYHKGDFAKAAEYFQKAADLGHDVHANLEGLAEAKYRLGDIEGAHAVYQQLLDEGYETFSLFNNLANLKVKRDEHAAAAALLRRALGLGLLTGEVEMRLRHNIEYLENRD